jgi:DNA-directed RNA polymerase subunit K/omega
MNEKYAPIEKLLPYCQDSIFKLAVLAAKRALQLADGARALIDKPGEKVLDTALAEIALGRVRVVVAKEKKG